MLLSCQHKMATVSDPVILHAFAATSQVTVIRAIDHHHPQRHRVPTEVLDPQVRSEDWLIWAADIVDMGWQRRNEIPGTA
jgi:hypothetical protein